MKDLAILVDNKNDSTEAQDLLFSMGYEWRGLGEISKSYFYPKMNKYFIFMNKNEMDLQMAGYFAGSSRSYAESQCKEITLPELRDMVVLKRNNVGDATHKGSITDNVYYVSSDEEVYRFESSAWCFSTVIVADLKPIEKPMKEYLRKNSNDTYSYIGTVRPEHVSDFMIEIPEGAQVYAVNNGYHYFFSSAGIGFEWSVLWQHPSHPEELPFIDDEPLQSLNDQYAEIEKVRQTLNQRQEQYGSFEDVAMITEQMVDVMRKGYYENLAYNQKMALYMICSKMARIVNGNPNHKDSWHDIAGYATLIDNELVSEKDMPF